MKLVVAYSVDGGYNAENTLYVHCIEYESVEKFQADLAEAAIAANTHPNYAFYIRFAGHQINVSDMLGPLNSGLKTLSNPPLVMKLEDWWDYWSQQNTDGRFLY